MPEVIYRGNKRKFTIWDGTVVAKHQRTNLTPAQWERIEDKSKFTISKSDPVETPPRASVVQREITPPVQQQSEEGGGVTNGRTE